MLATLLVSVPALLRAIPVPPAGPTLGSTLTTLCWIGAALLAVGTGLSWHTAYRRAPQAWDTASRVLSGLPSLYVGGGSVLGALALATRDWTTLAFCVAAVFGYFVAQDFRLRGRDARHRAAYRADHARLLH